MAVPVTFLTSSKWPLDLAISLLNKEGRIHLMATLKGATSTWDAQAGPACLWTRR